MTSLDDFLDRLGSRDPVPGGGSVAALEVAIGASLLTMVCGLTLGRKKYEEFTPKIDEVASAAAQIGVEARRLVEEDATAYNRVADAMKLPRGTEEEKTARREKVQQALKEATAPPLRTMELADSGVELATSLVSICNSSAISDVGTAVLSFVSGFHAGRLNVAINLASIKDAEFVSSTRGAMADTGGFDARASEVVAAVEREIGGGG